jgi:hypothetical protein
VTTQPALTGANPSGAPDGPAEVLSDTKELSHIHGVWYGPSGYQLPIGIPYVGAAAGGLAFVFALPLVAVIGVHGLWHYGAAALLAIIAGWLIYKNTSSDRSVWVLLAGLAREASAPRPPAPEPAPGRGRGHLRLIAGSGREAGEEVSPDGP